MEAPGSWKGRRVEMPVTPNLHFSGTCAEAIEWYRDAFGAEVLCLLKNSDADPADYQADSQYADFVYHAELSICGSRVMMSDLAGESGHAAGNSCSLVVTFDSAEEVLRAFEKLKAGAEIFSPVEQSTYSSCFVSLIDKFGMRWELMTELPAR